MNKRQYINHIREKLHLLCLYKWVLQYFNIFNQEGCFRSKPLCFVIRFTRTWFSANDITKKASGIVLHTWAPPVQNSQNTNVSVKKT